MRQHVAQPLSLGGARVYVGPAGWSYADSPGIVYPKKMPAGKVLEYISRYFNTVEVNVSFYRFVTARMSESWVGKVADPERFQFTYKLNQVFTHEGRQEYTAAQVREYREGLGPVAQAGMLGAVLAQFPWSFRYNDESIAHVHRLREDFGDYPLAVEVRHAGWQQQEAIERLREAEVSLCAIDQPAMAGNLPPMDVVTGPIAYVRLHGRNSAKWFAENVQGWERYDYFYGEEQLKEWGERIGRLASSAERVFVIANNHYKGQGAANALQLRHELSGQQVEVPPTLEETYPVLGKIAASRGGGERQDRLF